MPTSAKNEHYWVDDIDIDIVQQQIKIASDKLHASITEDKLWGNIRRKARTDPGLQDLLNQAIMYYELGKEVKPK